MKYKVILTAVYNGYVDVEASNPREALKVAQDNIDVSGLPNYAAFSDGSGAFQFGEATADYIEDVEDDSDGSDDDDGGDTPSDSDIAWDLCKGVVREDAVMLCDEQIFGDDDEHEYIVDCSDGSAVAHAMDEKDPATLYLTYPKMEEVAKDEDMIDDIREYRGLPYNEPIHFGDVMMYCGEIKK